MSCHAPAPSLAVLDEPPLKAGQPRGRFRTIALIGPPNSGKSTLFNRLTGLRQKVANYPGVTVEQRSGRMSGIRRNDLTLIDLPGIYSLTGYSEDARVADRCAEGRDARHAAAGCGTDRAGRAEPEPAAHARRADSRPGTAHHGAAEYGGPDGVARRRRGSAGAGAGAGTPGRADQRRTRHRHRRHRALPAAARQQPSRIREDTARPSHRAAGVAESRRVPPLGLPGQQPDQVQGAAHHRCGRAGSTPCCCTASWGR